MDPNRALRNIRLGIDEFYKEDGENDIEQINETMESFLALDEWLVAGGFLPSDWRRR